MDDLTRLFLAGRDGDRGALTEAVRSSQGEVWRFCAHLAGRDAADDLTQEIYLRALRSLPSFRGDSSARTWLLTIARRTCIDSWRRRSRRARLASRAEAVAGPHRPGADGRDAAGSEPDPARWSSLAALVDDLGDDQREAFVLTQVVGCSYEEAAAVCTVPIGTIRSRVARARSDLARAVRAAEAR